MNGRRITEEGPVLKSQVQLLLTAVTSWLGLGIVNAADARLAKSGVLLAQAAPAGAADVLADFTLSTFLLVGSLVGAYVYYAGTWVKDKVFRAEPTQYKLFFASGAFLLGALLGLVAVKTAMPVVDRGWCFVGGAGGSLASWGVYDAILILVVAKARRTLGVGDDPKNGGK